MMKGNTYMKVASIVLNSIGIGVYLLVAIILMTASGASGESAIGAGLIVAIVLWIPIITSIISIVVITTSRSKNGGFTFQGIMDMLFGNLLGGVFMLCIDEKDLKKKTAETSANNGENKQ